MTASRLDRFTALSAELTAFSSVALRGTGNADSFLGAMDDILGSDIVDELLDAFESVEATEDAARTSELRRTLLGDEKLGAIARNVIKLWYVGIWYQLPDAWRQRWGAHKGDQTHTVSANAYTQGLLWPACGANPAGAKAPGYGSWAEPPRIPTP